MGFVDIHFSQSHIFKVSKPIFPISTWDSDLCFSPSSLPFHGLPSPDTNNAMRIRFHWTLQCLECHSYTSHELGSQIWTRYHWCQWSPFCAASPREIPQVFHGVPPHKQLKANRLRVPGRPQCGQQRESRPAMVVSGGGRRFDSYPCQLLPSHDAIWRSWMKSYCVVIWQVRVNRQGAETDCNLTYLSGKLVLCVDCYWHHCLLTLPDYAGRAARNKHLSHLW